MILYHTVHDVYLSLFLSWILPCFIPLVPPYFHTSMHLFNHTLHWHLITRHYIDRSIFVSSGPKFKCFTRSWPYLEVVVLVFFSSPWTIESIDDIAIPIHHKSRWATRVICTSLANQHLATVHVDFFHRFPRKDGFEATIFWAGFQATCFFDFMGISWGFHGDFMGIVDCWGVDFMGPFFFVTAMIYRG